MTHDCIIIGGGPAGYEAAAIAVRQGKKTLLAERAHLGGTCLNCGCIPTKSFCRSAEVALTVASAAGFGITVPGAERPVADMPAIVARKDTIVEQLRQGVAMLVEGAESVRGEARFTAQKEIEVDGNRFSAPEIVIATGSCPATLPVPGAGLAITSTGMLSLQEVPDTLAIIGGGVIGIEFASIFAALGSDVTVVEYCKEILPLFDRDIAKRLRTALQRRGIKFCLAAEVTAIEGADGGTKRVLFTSKGKPAETVAETVLMAVGRRPVIPDGAADAGYEITRRGFAVNERYETNIPGTFAIGDCNGVCLLAHAASAQARLVMGENVNLSVIPSAVFSFPECAMAGLTEEQCKEQGLGLEVGKAFYRANGKALAMGESDGLVKTLVSTADRRLLGCHICGPHAADLIAEATLAISAGLPADAIAATIHSHPTLSELIPASLPR